MKKLNNTRGVLLFAFNNEQINYVDLAIYCGERVHRTWGLPVTVVTDTPFAHEFINCVTTTSPEVYSTRFFKGYKGQLKFLNGNRDDAWTLSPYEQTIVLDTDFLVATTQIPDVWDGKGVKLSKTASSLSGRTFPLDMTHLGKDGLPMYWATVLCFDRSRASEWFFQYWKKAKRWYKAYANVYGFTPTMLRNDYCVTIALDLLSQKIGSTDPFTLDYAIPTAGFDIDLVSLDPLQFTTEGTILTFPTTDVHVLNKHPLLELIGQES